MRCAKKCFLFFNFGDGNSGMPMPEICFLQGQFRRTILPKEHHGDSLIGRGSNAQPSD